jgi:hypothetical protein
MYIVPALSLPEVAQILKEQFKEVGVTVNLKPSANYVNEFVTPQVPGAGLVPQQAGVRQKLRNYLGDNIGNTCKFSDPVLEALDAQLAPLSENSDDAVAIWQEIDEYMAEEALSVWILFGSKLGAYDSDALADMQVYPYGNYFVPDIYTTYATAG